MKYIVLAICSVMLVGCAGDKVFGRYNNRPTLNTYATNTAYTYDKNNNMVGYTNYRSPGK